MGQQMWQWFSSKWPYISHISISFEPWSPKTMGFCEDNLVELAGSQELWAG